MLEINHVVLPSDEQMQFVIEGMRNPKNSWDRSDSDDCDALHACDRFDRCNECKYRTRRIGGNYAIGPNDNTLMTTLAQAGTEHRKYMRMMPVYARITAPLYWWKEFDTYKVGTVANSCSTMHKIAAKEFTLDDFSHEHVGTLPMPNERYDKTYQDFEWILNHTIDILNKARKAYLETKDKNYWWQMIQLLPSSYNQTRNVMLNYEVLANIYCQRRNHKLDEWHTFCDWIEKLPLSELMTGKEK